MAEWLWIDGGKGARSGDLRAWLGAAYSIRERPLTRRAEAISLRRIEPVPAASLHSGCGSIINGPSGRLRLFVLAAVIVVTGRIEREISIQGGARSYTRARGAEMKTGISDGDGRMARVDFDAREIVEFAAQGGAPDALFELGLMYCSGREVDMDLVQAHKWFNLAALRGNDEAKRYRLEISSEMSKMDIAEAQRQAREWLKVH
ncbi:MAG: hypothetical protein ACT4N2_05870 [Hyphomicrobium sp.]